jgi:hypothetical protein
MRLERYQRYQGARDFSIPNTQNDKLRPFDRMTLPPNTVMREVPIRGLDGESYLARPNCEFRDRLGEIHAAQGVRAAHRP